MSGDEDTREPLLEQEAPVEAEEAEREAIENEAEQLLDEVENETLSAEELARQLDEASNKAKENWDKLLRMQAEMENLRRRTEKELQNAHKFALERFVKELLPVIDSVELAVQAASVDAPDISKIREGNELILQQFLSVLEKFNVTALDPVGEPFNPDRHEAMSMQPRADVEPNTVVQVFQKGFLLNDRLIRPAMVIVAQADTKQRETDKQA
jgi:molecular chaperone GrpE